MGMPREREDADVLARARARWSSLRDPERYLTYERVGWSWVARQGWGNARGRPYERTEIPGAPGLLVYAIVGAFTVLTLLLVLALVGILR